MNRLSKITSVFISVTTVIWVSGSSLLVPIASADHSTAHTIQQLLDQIALLQQQLTALQGGGQAVTCNFTSSLTVGSRGDAVKCLQQYLNGAGFKVAGSGAGSPGNETTYFGSLTRAAVAAWQAANGVSPAVGYFGPISRAKYSALVAGPGPTPTPTPGVSPTPAPPGTGLAVAKSATQPVAGLHPDNALRVPYTYADFTASADGDVTVDSVTVERQGASTDATFSGVVIVDENGIQIGVEKTLNSDHQATLTDDFVVKAGTTRRMVIAGNRGTAGSNGTTANFAVVGVALKGGAKLSGTLPISGTTHTMNVGGLTIGTVTVSTGPAKSVATTTEDIGKSQVFSAVNVAAGSTEDVRVLFIRFNQTGTAGKGDIGDLKGFLADKEYPVTVSSDGKYYTVDFSPGEIVKKGETKEVKIQGTLLRSNRTYHFDIYRNSDMGFSGELYGFGMNITVGTGFTTTNPVYWASDVTTRKGGTITIEKDPLVEAQNIAVNVNDQPLAGFTVDVKGESISVASMVFRVGRITQTAGASARNADDIDQIKLVDGSGRILAGPVDGSGTTVTFSDTVTFPIGKTRVKLNGKLDTDWANDEGVGASTTASSNWTTVTGLDSSETITPAPTSSISGNTMTVKGASLKISVATVPVAQNVVSGIQQFLFTTYTLDATQAGENMRMSSIPLEYNVFSGTASNLTSCTLYDGATAVTTGGNVINPSGRASSTPFTFDGSGIVVSKGTVKNLDLKCNIAGGITGSYSWGYDDGSSPTAVGLTSSQSITPTEVDGPGQRMTVVSSGSYTVTNNNTPGYLIANAGATGATLVRLRFSAVDEDVDIQRVAFQLNGVASNTPVDLVNQSLKLYDESTNTLVATAQFTAGGDFATSSIIASGAFRISKGGSKDMAVKGDIAAITTSGPLVRSGDFLRVDYDGDARGLSGGNYGVGAFSGTTITPTSSDTPADTNVGVRIMKSYPSFAKITLTDRVLRNGDNTYPLYRFSVQSVGGDVHLYKLTFNLSTTTISGNTSLIATTSKYSLYSYTDVGFTLADTTAPGNGTAAGLINGGQCAVSSAGNKGVASGVGIGDTSDVEIFPTTACVSGTTTYKISPGTSNTRYFEFRANVASVEAAASVQNSIDIKLRGDAAFPTSHQNAGIGGGISTNLAGDMGQAGAATTTVWESGKQGGGSDAGIRYGVDGDTNNDLIWSPASTSTAPTISDFDFTNGYQVPGLPATDMGVETFTSTN